MSEGAAAIGPEGLPPGRAALALITGIVHGDGDLISSAWENATEVDDVRDLIGALMRLGGDLVEVLAVQAGVSVDDVLASALTVSAEQVDERWRERRQASAGD